MGNVLFTNFVFSVRDIIVEVVMLNIKNVIILSYCYIGTANNNNNNNDRLTMTTKVTGGDAVCCSRAMSLCYASQ